MCSAITVRVDSGKAYIEYKTERVVDAPGFVFAAGNCQLFIARIARVPLLTVTPGVTSINELVDISTE